MHLRWYFPLTDRFWKSPIKTHSVFFADTDHVTHTFCANMEGTEQETVVRRHRVGELMCPYFRTQ